MNRPSAEELLRRASAIGEVVGSRAQEIEKARRCPDDVAQMIREAELLRVMKPRAFGGFEYDFNTVIELIAAVGKGDGSMAWVFATGMVHQWLIGCYPLETQKEVWGKTPEPFVAGSYAPVGNVTVENNGYRIHDGRWSFASGCDVAQWVFLSTLITTEKGRQAVFLLVPREEVELDNDWDTVGLAATGSKTVIARDVFVPAHRGVPFADLLAGKGPGAEANGPLYRQPLIGIFPATIMAPALGMARATIEAFTNHVNGRTTRGAVAGGANRMRDFTTVQLRLAEATASVDAATLMLHRDIRETHEAAMRGDAHNIDLRIRNRLNHAFVTRLLMRAVDVCFEALGGNALGMSHPIQRYWRDIHAVGSHISLNWDAVGAMYGQHVFGLELKGQY